MVPPTFLMARTTRVEPNRLGMCHNGPCPKTYDDGTEEAMSHWERLHDVPGVLRAFTGTVCQKNELEVVWLYAVSRP